MPHLRKAGRLVDRPAIVNVAVKLARTDADKEVRNVLEGIPLTELPDSWSTDSLGGTESDEDGVDRVVNEGGTGYSSECSDGELPMTQCSDIVHAPSSPNATSPTAVESKSVMPSSPEGGGTSTQLASVEIDSSSPKQSDQAGGPPSPGPLRDLVEDSLVEQGDVERVMDATFADRRLLMEVEGSDAENAAVQTLETNTQVVTQSTDEKIPLTEELPDTTQSENAPTSTIGETSVATHTTPDMSDIVDTPSDGHLNETHKGR